MSRPQVSVLMPVYNAGRYVVEAVESILEQTYSDFEFLIVDDGSTDDSLVKLLDLSRKDERIKLTSRANTGYVVALNEMMENATGEFIARMDADDLSTPVRFEKQVQQMEMDSSLVAIGTRTLLVDPENRDLCILDAPTDHERIDQKHLSGIGGMIAHPSSMMRASALRTVHGYRTEFWPAEDVDLFLRLAEVGRLSNVPQVGIRYRLHHDSTGHKNRGIQTAAAKKAAIDAHIRRGMEVPEQLKVEGAALRSDYRMTWAWWALQGKNIATARRYAIQAFLQNPLSKERARLLYCALRGR